MPDSVRSVVVSKGGQVFVDRVDPGHDGPPRRPRQLLRDRERVPRAAAQVAVRTDELRPMLRRYVTAVVGRPKLVIAAVVLVTLVLGFFISRLRVLLDVDQQIPPGHPLVIVGKRIEKLFGGKYMTVVGFYSESGTDLHARHPGQGQARHRGAGEDPGRQAGQRAVADVAARSRTSTAPTTRWRSRRWPPRCRERRRDRRVPRARQGERVPDQPVRQRRRARRPAVLVDFDDFKKAGGPPKLAPTLEAIVGARARGRGWRSCPRARRPSCTG